MKPTTMPTAALMLRGVAIGVAMLLVGATHPVQAQTMLASIQSDALYTGVYANAGAGNFRQAVSHVNAQVHTIATITHGRLLMTHSPVVMSEEGYIQLEVEGKTLNAKLSNPKGLRGGVWAQRHVDQSQI